MKSTLNIYWEDWCWSSSTLTTWCEELTHWKRSWCWERLKAGGERDNRGWNDWMASLTQRTWVWASSGKWWRTGKPGMLQSTGSQRVRQDSNWTMREYEGSLMHAPALKFYLIPHGQHFIRGHSEKEEKQEYVPSYSSFFGETFLHTPKAEITRRCI